MKWFDRKFTFKDVDGTFVGIIERLSGTPIRLRHKIDHIPNKYYRVQIEKSWSIQEQVGHLGDLEALWQDRFADFITGKELLTPADLTNQRTHKADHNDQSMQDLLTRFDQQRSKLCESLMSISEMAETWVAKHPRLLTPMRPIDLAYFIAEHDDHHLARISEIARQLKP